MGCLHLQHWSDVLRVACTAPDVATGGSTLHLTLSKLLQVAPLLRMLLLLLHCTAVRAATAAAERAEWLQQPAPAHCCSQTVAHTRAAGL